MENENRVVPSIVKIGALEAEGQHITRRAFQTLASACLEKAKTDGETPSKHD
jgi:hypothetical protein